VALVIKDKPMTLARLRAGLIYRLGAVPRGESVMETYVDPAVATVDHDMADLELVVLHRLELQDSALGQLAAANERLRAGMGVLARKLQVGCDAVGEAAGIAERLSAPETPDD